MRARTASAVCAGALAFAVAVSSAIAAPTASDVQRGKYLVAIMGCTQCHTRGAAAGNPDATRFLAGADFGFGLPGLGVFVPRNLTPDKETGLGNWSVEDIAKAITTGERPDGRILSPAMPWVDFANMTPSDALSIAAYLKSLPAVKNAIPGPFGPSETPTLPVIPQWPLAPADYAKIPQPAAP